MMLIDVVLSQYTAVMRTGHISCVRNRRPSGTGMRNRRRPCCRWRIWRSPRCLEALQTFLLQHAQSLRELLLQLIGLPL